MASNNGEPPELVVEQLIQPQEQQEEKQEEEEAGTSSDQNDVEKIEASVAAEKEDGDLHVNDNDHKEADEDAVTTEKKKKKTNPDAQEQQNEETRVFDAGGFLKRQNAIKVIKGEIHNVFQYMRTDVRYASPLRFRDEIIVEDHVLLQSFKDLHEALSVWDLNQELQVALYLTPFCNAITGRDISASVTGAALSALHKFLLYGFIQNNAEGMILITKSLLHCTFEETTKKQAPKSAHELATTTAVATTHDDEQVVLKLLSLSALVVRCALEPLQLQQHQQQTLANINENVDNTKNNTPIPLLDAKLICGLLDTCLHVSHRAKHASPLLRSAASDSLSQIVLVVFSSAPHAILEARSTILSQLASLVDPQQSTDVTCVSSLTLVNIALETMQTVSKEEVHILHNELCKHMLTWSQTNDLVILSLTLRVIFNLFQSMLRNQMKVPLEIFLTSVHIRILEHKQTFAAFSGNEQREVALESLLEFCQEPSLMMDLYLNYDCDMNCTNLFETILQSLSRMATPQGSAVMNLNKLAFEGIFAVIESIVRKCTRSTSSTKFIMGNHSNTMATSATTISDADDDLSDLSHDEGLDEEDTAGGSGTLNGVDSNNEQHRVFQERKRKKHLIQQVSHHFNNGTSDWIVVAQDMQLFDIHVTPARVAEFLYNTPHLDKTQLGLYLSKGPDEKYPFNAEVRTAFCELFDFKSSSFSKALRDFLQKFRLPGEAQCIDRLMESFASELYKQQQDPIFNSSDAVFRMAFSTIMLNTDLHNPGMKQRMSLEDFIKNNRGCNDDQDFARDFLQNLYYDIKENEFAIQREFMEVLKRISGEGELTAKHWEACLARQTEDAFFTRPEDAHCNIFQAGIHDRDMFVTIAKPVIQCVSKIFAKSKSNALVIKALKCLKDMAKICIFFDLDETLNEILTALLGFGRDYIMSCIALEYAGSDGEQIMAASPQGLDDGGVGGGDDDDLPHHLVIEGTLQTPIPSHVLFTHNSDGYDDTASHLSPSVKGGGIEGSAAHRGLLALDTCFSIISEQPSKIQEAWPALVECICALRDARALPDRVLFLDDFADSRGNLLKLSPFAKQSQRRLDEYYQSLSNSSRKPKSLFASFFSTTTSDSKRTILSAEGVPSPQDIDVNDKELSPFSQALLAVAKRAQLDKVLSIRPKNALVAKQTIDLLLDSINSYPYFDDPTFEQHAIYSLELALLSLISNQEFVMDLLPHFMVKFETVLDAEGGFADDKSRDSIRSKNSRDGSLSKNLPTPFLMERVVVTILRGCIHLYDIADIRPELIQAMDLLLELPPSFMRYIADRMACGMAIFLSIKYPLFCRMEEWTCVCELMDKLSYFGPARGFVFDGIANTVESQLSPSSQQGDDKPILSLEGSNLLSRLLLKFVFGTYQKDMSLCVPAMLCLENLYRHTVMLQRTFQEDDEQEEDDNAALSSSSTNFNAANSALIDVPDQELWQNVAVAFYSVCRSTDAATSRQGTDCFQRFVASTKRDSLPDDIWLTMLHLIVMKQPPVTVEEARVNCCTILGKVLLMTIAHLSQDRANWEDLTDIVNQMAVLTGENLVEGRRGRVSPLFESTLQSITFLSNHMVSQDFTGDQEYGSWVSDTLLAELEKVGAGGGSTKNVAATTRRRP